MQSTGVSELPSSQDYMQLFRHWKSGDRKDIYANSSSEIACLESNNLSSTETLADIQKSSNVKDMNSETRCIRVYTQMMGVIIFGLLQQ